MKRTTRMRFNGWAWALALAIRLDWYRARRVLAQLGIGVHRGV